MAVITIDVIRFSMDCMDQLFSVSLHDVSDLPTVKM